MKILRESVANIIEDFRRVEWTMTNDPTDTSEAIEKRLKNRVTAILSVIGEEIPKMKECLPVESAEQITHDKMEEYETYKYGYNQALTDLRSRLEK